MSPPLPAKTRQTREQKVVIGGDRPPLRKSWPERLRKLLASAWDPDHTKRPSAAEIVAVLKIVEAELPTRDKRRPSFEASVGGVSTAPGSGGGSGRSSRQSSRQSSRRHSWTDATSTTRPTALSLTRLPTGSGTKSGGLAENGNGNGGDGAAPQHDSGPMPPTESLRLGTSASFNAAAPAKRKWFPMGKKASSGPVLTSGDDGAQPPEAGAASATPALYVDSAVGGKTVVGGSDGVDIRAPEWTTTATSDGGDGPEERRCQLHRTLMSLRDIISDALARETEGLPQSGEREASTPAYAVPTNVRAKTRAGEARENGKSGQGSSAGGSTVHGVAKERKEAQAEHPAATAAVETALIGVHDALDVPSEVRRNSTLGKIFRATPSPGHTKDHDSAAAAAPTTTGVNGEGTRKQ